MSFNIYFENQDMQNVADAVIQYQPDVVTMYELTSTQYDQLKPMLAQYYSYALEPTSAGNGAFSKYKLEDAKQTGYKEQYIPFMQFTRQQCWVIATPNLDPKILMILQTISKPTMQKI